MILSGEFSITTSRLRLRRFVPDDIEFLVSLLGDPLTMSHWPAPLSATEAGDWLLRALNSYAEHGFGRWLVELRDCGQPIGDVGIEMLPIMGRLETDLGYIIRHDHWGHGLGFEAASACVEWARDQGLKSVVESMAVDNSASIRVAERLDMKLDDEFNNPRNGDKLTRLYRLELSVEPPHQSGRDR